MDRDEIMKNAILFCAIATLFPLIYNGVRTVDASGWTFTGHAEAAVLLPLIPWLFLIASITALAYSVIKGRF